MKRLISLSAGLLSNFVAAPAYPCDLALLLAVDVSGSVSGDEYSIQMNGLARGLRDGIVVDALIEQQARVSVVQWSGQNRQRQTIPWTAIRDLRDVEALATRVENDPRVWRNFSTAIGEALMVSAETFASVPDCARKVIDVSGDGVSNEGPEPISQHAALRAQNITVNAIAIETEAVDLTAYFYENLITGAGAFVMTADGFEDFPVQIKRKLQRETTRHLSAWDSSVD